MGYRKEFSKSIVVSDGDRLSLFAPGSFTGEDDMLTLTHHLIGVEFDVTTINLSSDEAVRDLHYMLGAYLDHIKREDSRPQR